MYGYLCFWHLQTFEDSRRVNYTESVGRTETITRRLVKKYNFPSNFVCCYFGGRLFIKTFNGMNLFKSRASLEYLRVPLIFINLIRADRSWHILYKHSFSYNPSVISNSLFSIQYLSIQFKIFPDEKKNFFIQQKYTNWFKLSLIWFSDTCSILFVVNKLCIIVSHYVKRLRTL